jgi:hypothetical protein
MVRTVSTLCRPEVTHVPRRVSPLKNRAGSAVEEHSEAPATDSTNSSSAAYARLGLPVARGTVYFMNKLGDSVRSTVDVESWTLVPFDLYGYLKYFTLRLLLSQALSTPERMYMCDEEISRSCGRRPCELRRFSVLHLYSALDLTLN